MGQSDSKPPASYICNNCGIGGHYIQDCPKPLAPPEGYTCHKCGVGGHTIKQCPSGRPMTDKPPSNYTCDLCNVAGHWKSQCPKRYSSWDEHKTRIIGIGVAIGAICLLQAKRK